MTLATATQIGQSCDEYENHIDDARFVCGAVMPVTGDSIGW